VSGIGSTWNNVGNVNIGVTGTGNLVVTGGGLVSGSTITIGAHGTVMADGGTLQGAVLNNGTLDPSSAINIVGSYEQTSTGILTLDVTPTGYGSINVTGTPGTVTLDNGSTIDVDFIDGFTPQVGDIFQFITSTGGVTNNGLTVDFSGTAPGASVTGYSIS
jgi:hypothetical protein